VAVNSPAFVRAAFACLRRGEVFVPLRGEHDEQRLKLCPVTRVIVPEEGFGWVTETALTDRSDRIAQVMFTSGTEGAPKGVLLTHRGRADVVERLHAVMHLDSSIREYVGVPVYHSFGFGRCRAVAAAGGSFYIPERGFNPLEIATLLTEGKINAISAVPSLWRVLLDSGAVGSEAGRRVRWIEIGSQYMSREEKEQLRALFPNAAIVQHYGLTEASRSTFLEVHTAQGKELESVGKPTGSVEVRLTADGRVAIRGPHVAAKLLLDGKLSTPVDAEGWLETNDLGELRDGFLYYLGRADDIINCGGLKLPPEALEARVRASLQIPGDFAIFRAPDRVRGDGIVLAALPSVSASDSALMEATALAAQDLGVNSRGAIRVMRIAELPKTASGKVQRRLLTEQATREAKAQEEAAPAPASILAKTSVAAIFVRYLGARSPAPTATFTNLGGDSLAFIQTSVALEALLGYLPPRWEETSLAELEQMPKKESSSAQLEPMVWLRALAIGVIISNHSHLLGDLAFPGGASLLLVLSGATFARFQLQRVIREHRAWPLLAGLPKILIPAMGLQLLQQVQHHHFYASPVLLFSNFVSPKIEGFWFIEVWVQIYVALFLVFAALPVWKVAKARPLVTALSFLLLGVAMRVLVPQVWDTDGLFGRLPHLKFWLFALGWTITTAALGRRWLATGLVVLLARVLYMGDIVQSLWVGLGSLALIWLPVARVPSFVARSVAWISAASLYIYIAQYHFFRIADHALPAYGPQLGWLLAMVGGGVLRELADRAWPWVTALRERFLPSGGAARASGSVS
jgi:acyl-CoA synthetase (AMP-forming)/AMP-acid ligase II